MDILVHRSWMYDRLYPQRGGLKPRFVSGVQEFINHASLLPQFLNEETIRCPCIRCINKGSLLPPNDVMIHLYTSGFKPNYWYWIDHEEVPPNSDCTDNLQRYNDMVYDAARGYFGQTFDQTNQFETLEQPNTDA